MTGVMYVFGTRPEFVRSAGILAEIERRRTTIELCLINTGQHYDRNMAGGFFAGLALPEPQESLNCGGRSRPEQISQIVREVAGAIERHRPSCLAVFGDTNSSLGGAIAATACDVPLVHVEAGARSHDMRMPEEVHRRLIDHASDLLLAVSGNCCQNLRDERVPGRVFNVGDPLYEIFRETLASISESSTSNARVCLMTLHRQGLVDCPIELESVLVSVGAFAARSGLTIAFPAHPRTAAAIKANSIRIPDNILVGPPLLYKELLTVLRTSELVITDSGGLQKEAFWAGKPCVTVRQSTEWVETIEAGANRLALGDQVGIVAEEMLQRGSSVLNPQDDPYRGVGASERIVESIIERYGS